jgi:hypothetical protein
MIERCTGAIHTPRPAVIRAFASLLQLPQTKPETDWFDGIDFASGPDPMLGNNDAGNCVEVSAFQIARARAHHAWGPNSYLPTTAGCLGLYTQRTGYTPPGMGSGTNTNEFMAWWATQGLPLGNPANDLDVIGWTHADLADTPVAIDLAGPVRITLALPEALLQAPVSAWGDAPGTGTGWEPGGWGQHSIAVGGQRDGYLNGETWAEQVWMHPDFLSRYWLATDVALSRFWITTTGLAPSDLDWASLSADVASLPA